MVMHFISPVKFRVNPILKKSHQETSSDEETGGSMGQPSYESDPGTMSKEATV
jgi:hypothetical protein